MVLRTRDFHGRLNQIHVKIKLIKGKNKLVLNISDPDIRPILRDDLLRVAEIVDILKQDIDLIGVAVCFQNEVVDVLV